MVTVNEPAVPTVKAAVFALVIAGVRFTVTTVVAVQLSRVASTWPGPLLACESNNLLGDVFGSLPRDLHERSSSPGVRREAGTRRQDHVAGPVARPSRAAA